MKATKLTPDIRPLINKFEATNYIENNGDKYLITSGRPFNLEWEVKNADSVELYKNGELFEKFNPLQKSVEITEQVYDGSSKKIKYKLVASNDTDIAERYLTAEIIFPVSTLTINDFSIKNYIEKNGSKYTIGSGESFTLQWNVKGAQKVSLYRNGQSYKQFNKDENSTNITENVYDGIEKLIEYTLGVTTEDNLLEAVEKLSLTVKVIYNNKQSLTEFSVSNYFEKQQGSYIVQSGKPFTLNWNIVAAKEAEIKKDGQYLKKIDSNTNSIELTETIYDGEEKKIQYELLAYSDTTSEAINEIVNIIVKKSISPIISSNPVIKRFEASRYILINGEPFVLNWEVKNADYIELYINNKLDVKFDAAITTASKKADFTAGIKKNSYKLIAYNESARTESKPIVLKQPLFSLPRPLNYYLKRVSVLLVGLLLLGFIFIWWPFSHLKNPVIKEIRPQTFYHNQPIAIYGENFPTGTDAIKVILNNVQAIIQASSKDSLIVTYPQGIDSSLIRGKVRVGVIVNNDTFYAPKTISCECTDMTPKEIKIIDSSSIAKDSISKRRTDTIAESNKPRPRREKVKEKTKIEARLKASKEKATADSLQAIALAITKANDDKKKDRENRKAIWEKNKYDLVLATSAFETKTFGGIKDVKIKITNNSGYTLDIVSVQVIYQKTEKNKEKKTAILQFTNIGPHSYSVQSADNGRGDGIILKIASIKTKEFE
jgi:hypothetical protein